MSKDYLAHFTRMNPGNFASTYQAAAAYYDQEIRPYLPPNKEAAILDVGSGFGFLLQYFFDLGFRSVSCLDTSSQLLAFIKDKFKDRLKLCAKISADEYLRKTSQQYDLITLIDVIEHLDVNSAQQTLRLVHRHLNTGGQVILRTPNMASLLGNYSRYMDITHLHGYTEYSLRQLLEEAGFSQIKIIPVSWPIFSRKWFFQKINNFITHLFYTLQDRVQPKILDKNIVLIAQK